MCSLYLQHISVKEKRSAPALHSPLPKCFTATCGLVATVLDNSALNGYLGDCLSTGHTLTQGSFTSLLIGVSCLE